MPAINHTNNNVLSVPRTAVISSWERLLVESLRMEEDLKGKKDKESQELEWREHTLVEEG